MMNTRRRRSSHRKSSKFLGDRSQVRARLKDLQLEGLEARWAPAVLVNAGGPEIIGTEVWEADTLAAPSPYLNAVASGASAFSTAATIDMSHPSIPAGTPAAVFQTERWDPAGGPEMQWDIPVQPGNYQVRLYFAEIFNGAQSVGARTFDVSIEGTQVLNDYDVFAKVGGFKGVVESFTVSSDNNLDIDFGHVVDNPAIKAIEVVPLAPPAGSSVLVANKSQINFESLTVGQSSTQSLVLSNQASGSGAAITVVGAAIHGGAAEQFSETLSASSPLVLQPGESTSLSVTYQPLAAGSHGAELSLIHSTDAKTFQGGDTIQYQAFASGGPGATYDWSVELVKPGSTTPLSLNLPNAASGSFVVPSSGVDYTSDSSLRISVTITDSLGNSTIEQTQLYPELVNVTIETTPSGIPVTLDGESLATPSVQSSLIGYEHVLQAAPSYCLNGTEYEFQSWSSGPSANQVYVVPGQDVTVNASYLAVGTCTPGEPSMGPAGMEMAGRTGNAWWVSRSDGTEIADERWVTWASNPATVDVQVADVNGDGLDDIVGRQDGAWRVAVSQGDQFTNEVWGAWSKTANWQFVQVGDFDGNGQDDIAGYVNGNWWIARSVGDEFVNEKWTSWNAKANWQNVLVGDFNGDGRDDIAGRAGAAWWVAESNGAGFDNINWGAWSPTADWRDVHAADMDGDGRDDIMGRANGTWWIAKSNGSEFTNEAWGHWSRTANWEDVRVDDFNGDGKADIAGRASGNWWVSTSTGSAFTTTKWGEWNKNVTWQDVRSGDMDGDGRADILGRVNGNWWVATSDGSSFSNSLWTQWSPTANWLNVLIGNFAPDGSSGGTVTPPGNLSGRELSVVTVPASLPGVAGLASVVVPLTGVATSPVTGTPGYHINAGGPELIANETWQADTFASPSIHVNASASASTTFSTAAAIDLSHPSIPAGTPAAIFQTERWDSNSGAEMQWDFPVTPGNYEVRLYFAEIFTGTQAVGARQFDVSIEGSLVLDNYDVFALVGANKGIVEKFTVTSDGNLDINFARVTNNPSVKAIEVVPVDFQPGQLSTLDTSLDFGSIVTGNTATRTAVLTNLGGLGDPAITISGTTISGSGAASFADNFNDASPVVLQPGQSLSIQVNYTSGSTGTHAATLNVSHNGSNPTIAIPLTGTATQPVAVGFGKATVQGTSVNRPTSLQFGPDDRLYVADQNGEINVHTIQRNGANDYSVTATETISLIKNMQNHNDDGNPSSTSGRLVTGLLVTGTAQNPVIYAVSSDPRIGAGPNGADLNLDTNSGVLSRLTWTGSQWTKLDLVRGLPRSEENHTANGLTLDESTNILYIAQGGNTNMGAPSNNFALLPEFALSAAILSVDLNAIGETTYDLPTLDDEDRPGENDFNDPFGGNDGKNQAKLVPGGPVQVYASGYRNPYDVVLTESGKLYSIDNGSNAGWGGIPIGSGANATNQVSEPGITEKDNLHLVTQGSYAGHANPTRANLNNTFNASNPQSPISVANPIEGTYLPAGAGDGALAIFPASTNGLTEYTGSNFGGDMKGDLLTAGFDNKIYRIQLNGDGTQVIDSQPIFSSVGIIPLDVTAQGDTGVFPGTIWVADHIASTIIVFEPNDFGGGGGGPVDPNDLDGDGYSNDDEAANGTDPNSAADFPADWDEDFLSNLLDTDDDNDTVADVSDPFAIDAANGRSTPLPVLYTWENDADNAGGILNMGFTGLMSNGIDDYETLYDISALTAGGAAGVLTMDEVSEGTALGAANTQEQAFQFGVNVTASTPPVTAHTRVSAPFSGITPQAGQQIGLFIGNGDQDNYVSVFVDGGGFVQSIKEVNAAFTGSATSSVTLATMESIDLFLTLDPAASTVQPAYSVKSGGVMGPKVLVGSPVSVPSSWWTGSNGLAVGMISTSAGPAPSFPATWDFMEVTAESTAVPSSTIVINPGNDIDASTFSANSFRVSNTSTGTNISSVRFDIATALLPDMVFDPNGTAGDLVAKGFTINTSSDVGTVGHSYANPKDDGFTTLEVTFTDFGPGEQFQFSIDVDPTSIRGTSAPGPNESGSVSGLELTGTQVRVTYSDGSIHDVELFRTPGSVGASQQLAPNVLAAAPAIELLGLTTPTNVTSASQTVRVNGPVGAEVRLLIVEAGMFLTGLPNGGFDVDPFEANSVILVGEQTSVIGSSSFVDIPVTLTKSNVDGGIHYIVAAFENSLGGTSDVSNILVVEFDPAV